MTDIVKPHDWDGVARAKLVKVLGPQEGEQVYTAVLAELKLPRLSTRREFLDAASALAKRGGFAASVGSILSVHAIIHRDGEVP